MNKKKKESFDKVLDELIQSIEMKKISIEDAIKVLNESEQRTLSEVEYLRFWLRLSIPKTFYKNSILAEDAYVYNRLFEYLKILATNESLKLEVKKIESVFVINDFLSDDKLHQYYFENIKLITDKNFPKFKDSFDYELVFGKFFDYLIVRHIVEAYEEFDSSIKTEYTNLFKTIEVAINNLIQGWDGINEEELIFKKTHTFRGKHDFFEFHLTESMIESFKESLRNSKETLNEINLNIIEGIGKKQVEMFYKLVKLFNFNDFLNKPLENLAEVFPKDLKETKVKKALYINDLLVLFKHPEAYDDKKISFLLKGETINNYAVDTYIKRMVVSIVKNLK